MQLQVELLEKAELERFHLLVEQVHQLHLLALLQLVGAAVAFANLDAVAEESVVGDAEGIHRAAPREGGLLGGLAGVERNSRFTVGPREVAVVGFADVDHNVLLGAKEQLALAHQLFQKGMLHADLIDRGVAHVIVEGNFSQVGEIASGDGHLSLQI
ncbi:hypothetical protein D3C71_1439270 [compost metagenome]